MKDENLPDYWDLMNDGYYQTAHKMAKSSFGTYRHHLAGRVYLLHMLVKLPILAQCSAANPALIEVPALAKWIDDLQRHKKTLHATDWFSVVGQAWVYNIVSQISIEGIND